MWWVKWWKIHSASLHVIGAKYSTVYSVKLSASSYNNPGWTGAVSGRLFWGQSCSLNCDGVVKIPIVVGGRLSCRDLFLQAATVTCECCESVMQPTHAGTFCVLKQAEGNLSVYSPFRQSLILMLTLDRSLSQCACWWSCQMDFKGRILMENNSIRSSFFLWQLFGSMMHDNFCMLTDIFVCFFTS